MIAYRGDLLRDVESASRREWLEANGLGGFAASTIVGLNTRRYHALLTAALPPPHGRIVYLSKLEEGLHADGRVLDLGCNQYPGALHPRGFEYLKEFRVDPFPVYSYECGGACLEKQVAMTHGRNATIVTYTLTGAPSSVTLDLYPLLACRDYHQLSRENPFVNGAETQGPNWVGFQLYDGLPRLCLSATGASYERTGHWHRQVEYLRELERGLDFREDLFNPGLLRVELRKDVPLHVVVALEPVEPKAAVSWLEAEKKRRDAAVGPLHDGGTGETLARAADKFLIRRPDGGASVIAGYPWFTDWGRDTMIALPGLTLPTERFDEARAILRDFARTASQGMIPNRFPDGSSDPDYNTVDATLWFFVAAWRLLEATRDRVFAEQEMLPVFESILEWHRRGTRFDIHEEPDGLLHAGVPGVQLTWMDAKIGDWVVTPRIGKPVEINALWYNAQRITGAIARRTRPELADACEAAAERTRAAFVARFWDESRGYLADVVDAPDTAVDASLRPNQVFALSLPFPLIEGETARRILSRIEESLVTPCGLRTLDPGHPQYRGRYEGDPWSRDSAYHQGTVWPWPMGSYWEAKLKVEGFTKKAKAAVRAQMEPLLKMLSDAGAGGICEVLDGDPPHRPGGCFTQAWSVSEVLRLWTLTK
jgi:predicted glycogen debranching enzyme